MLMERDGSLNMLNVFFKMRKKEFDQKYNKKWKIQSFCCCCYVLIIKLMCVRYYMRCGYSGFFLSTELKVKVAFLKMYLDQITLYRLAFCQYIQAAWSKARFRVSGEI